ncbi:MAG TPA: DUF4252 domain-containing protein [Vicinamibacterales bacterium]|nr:DUF4252 domain-containing protein [Vicinamibacterales bacterium]
MKLTLLTLACALLVPAAPFAQTFTIPDRIEKLSAKAKESVNVTLDGPLLQLAGQFLNSGKDNERSAKEIVSKLRGIHVRSFEFAKEGEYTEADLEAIRSQLKSPAWTRVVDSREEGEHSQIFVKQENGMLGGVVILAAERMELSIVSIDGPIDLKQLSNLAGKFGIPSVPTQK